jgi:preprotein translocase subunit SecY
MELEIFKDLLFLIVFIYLIVLVIKKFSRWFPTSVFTTFLSPSNTHSIKELLRFLVTNNETRKRMFITLGVLIAVKIISYVPLPGVDVKSFGISIPGRFSIVSLGIMPFISACLLIQLLSAVIPHFKRTTFGDEHGRRKIVWYTCIMTVGLALVQSYGISSWLENTTGPEGVSLVTMQGVPFRIITMMTLTASVFLFLFLADIINKYGIGHGIALMVVSGILLGAVPWVKQCYNLYTDGEIGILRVLVIIVLVVGSLYAAFYFTNREKKIQLKDKRTKQEITIPLRVSWVANAPFILASYIIILPVTIIEFSNIRLLSPIASYFTPSTILYVIVEGILLFFCTYVYASIIFKPPYVQNLLQKYNFTYKSTEGKDPIGFLDGSLSKLLIITAVVLFILSKIPSLLIGLLSPRSSMGVVAYFVSTFGILMLAGVFFDILSQLEFFYKKNKASNKHLTVAYVAFDEIEAKIKSEYLKGKGINALVEPLRFTWGMPIRTAIDQYRIYTPAKDVTKARKLIE